MEIVGNDAFELTFENGKTSGVLFSSVVEVEVELLDELLEGVVLNLAPVGLSLGNSGNEGNQK